MVNYHKKGYIVMVFFLKRGTPVHKRGTWYYQYALMSPFRDQLKCLVWECPLCFPPSLLLCRPWCSSLLCLVIVGRSWRSQCHSCCCCPGVLLGFYFLHCCTCAAVGLSPFRFLRKFITACVCRSTCRIWIIQTTPMTELH